MNNPALSMSAAEALMYFNSGLVSPKPLGLHRVIDGSSRSKNQLLYLFGATRLEDEGWELGRYVAIYQRLDGRWDYTWWGVTASEYYQPVFNDGRYRPQGPLSGGFDQWPPGKIRPPSRYFLRWVAVRLLLEERWAVSLSRKLDQASLVRLDMYLAEESVGTRL